MDPLSPLIVWQSPHAVPMKEEFLCISCLSPAAPKLVSFGEVLSLKDPWQLVLLQPPV
jgi:hypothetical protein